MAKLKHNIVSVLALVGLAASLLLLYRARAGLHERDAQLQRLRDRMAELEDEVARLSDVPAGTGEPPDLKTADREAYLSLGYKEFDATPGSGHRRFRDRPRNPAQAAALVEAYLQRHTDLPLDQRMILHCHAAQLFAMGGMNQRAVTHLDRARLADGVRTLGAGWNNWVEATKAFLLLDREGLIAVRQRMAAGEDTKLIDHLIDCFGEPYADVARWVPLCSTVSVATEASPNLRAAAEQLAKAFGLSVTPRRVSAEGGIPGDCIWLEVRPMGSTPDVDGYVILHGNQSTIITATNQRWLDAAVKRFIESSRQRRGKHEAAFGLTTSFELAR